MIYQSATLALRLIEPTIAILNFSSESSVNKFDIATLNNLSQALDALEVHNHIQALIVTSDKPNFMLGADINEFLSLFALPEHELSTWLAKANHIFNRIEDLPFVTISALSGYVLGGGCECVLATDFRIASENVKIGLPETKLGIIPGFGGTVRLPRIIGADNAIEMICSGQELTAEQSLKLGLIDAVVDSEHLLEQAIKLANNAINQKLDFRTRRSEKKAPLALPSVEAQMCFSCAKAMVSSHTGRHYPALMQAIKSIEQGAAHNRLQAQAIENSLFVKLTQTSVAKALVGIFLNDQLLKSKAKQAAKQCQPIEHAAVLGAGIMGGGIAYQSARKGVPIIMKDITPAALELGIKEAKNLLQVRVNAALITPLSMAEILNRITATTEENAIEHSQVIIEAVTEDIDIKESVLQQAQAYMMPDAILCSNTSTIPITQLAAKLARPENFCGMHFFNPVHRMPLVEVIRGKKTSDDTINKAVTYALQIGKSPIVVNDCAGFFVNRVLFPYLAAFELLLRDGANFIAIDEVMEQEFGFPMGPAFLLDVIGIDTAAHAQQVMAENYPHMRLSKPDAIELLLSENRLGQKNGYGFYRYLANKKGKMDKTEDSATHELLNPLDTQYQAFSQEEIIARLITPLINEVIRSLDEGIIASPAEADIALVYGLGFPPFHGGAFRYIDNLGLQHYLDQADKLSHLGALYQVPQSLRDKAKDNEVYFPIQPLTGERL